MLESESKKFAEEKFKQLPELQYTRNMLHAKCMGLALEELSKIEQFNLKKLKRLIWIHDIGKVHGKENHERRGLEILEKEFKLDEIDKDCVLNHGSKGNPTTKEGKIFRYADGLSLFYPEILTFTFQAGAKEGKTTEEVKEEIKQRYEKYLEVYSDNEKVLDILKKNFNLYFK